MKNKKTLITILSLSLLLLIGLTIFAFVNSKSDNTIETSHLEAVIDKVESTYTGELANSDPTDILNESDTVTSNEIPTSNHPGEVETGFQEYDISLMAVGDNLLHMGIIQTGKKGNGTYDYSFLFDGISDYLASADIKIINQETILGGNELGFSGYPAFNSPTEVGDAISAAGFNVVLHSSNHSADQKIKGLLNCVDYWDNYPDILLTGIYKNTEDADNIPLLEIQDVTFAILNYTYGPNMETIPSTIEGHLNILCDYDKNNHLDFTTLNPKVIEDIKTAKTLADVVIVCPHWGTEYVTKPSSYQEKFAKQMTEAGADLIIGTHPHVVQPVEWITSENGNRALCYYSLGNYVSTQKNGLSMLEALAWVTFHVSEDSVVISKKDTGVIPLVCQYSSNPVRFEDVYALEDYTDKLAASHGIHSYGKVNLKLNDLQKWSDEILGYWVLPKSRILNLSAPPRQKVFSQLHSSHQ